MRRLHDRAAVRGSGNHEAGMSILKFAYGIVTAANLQPSLQNGKDVIFRSAAHRYAV